MPDFVDEMGRWVDGSLVAPSPLHDALRTGGRNEDGTVTQDNGDGTGVRTTFDPDGNVTATENLTGLPIPPPPEPTDAERIAELEAILAALLGDPP